MGSLLLLLPPSTMPLPASPSIPNALPTTLHRCPPSLCSPHASLRNALLPSPSQIPRLTTFPSSLRSSFLANPMFFKFHTIRSPCKKTQVRGGALTSHCSLYLSVETLQWVFSASAVILILLRNVAINKAFLVPLLALQAPRDVIGWIRGDYGLWASFLALIIRLFYYIPGELELLLNFMLLVITSPYQVMDFRRTPASLVVCAAIALYLAFQHFSRAGGVKEAIYEGAFIPSLAIVCLVCIPLAFLAQSF